MFMIFDSETTGLPRSWKAPVSDLANWPRVIQIAWALYDTSEQQVESQAYLIQPDGFTIPDDAQRVHNISTDRALAEGKKLAFVLQEFRLAVERSDLLIGHNVRFDMNVLSAEYLRLKLQPPFADKKRLCTMERATEFCRIPGPYGFKWPTLSQLHQALFQRRFEEAHDAGADVAACAKCFFELKRRGVFQV